MAEGYGSGSWVWVRAVVFGNGIGLWLCVWHRVLAMSIAEGYGYGRRLWHRAMAVPYDNG